MRKRLSVRRSRWAAVVIVTLLWLWPLFLAGQPGAQKPPAEGGGDLGAHMGWIMAVVVFIWGVYQYVRRKRDVREKRLAELEAGEEFDRRRQTEIAFTDEERYRDTLERELGTIGTFGSPDFASLPVSLDDIFVSLHISRTWRGEFRFDPERQEDVQEMERFLNPAEVMAKAFEKSPLLLIIGDPGSGKTTLLKYYALCCLQGKQRDLGFKKEVLPLFFPLRDLRFQGKRPVSLPENLVVWADKHYLNIPAGRFDGWLRRKRTLVLLDGLDEIGDVAQRREVCGWIGDVLAAYPRSRFVVTARWTGYRKRDCIELECPHLRADVLDFSPEQQREFLEKWFRAAYLSEFPDAGVPPGVWKNRQQQKGADKASDVIEFLERPENRGLRELAGIPMLLQIMALVWKEREYLPSGRDALYDSSINYLLGYRDQRRKIEPMLPVDQARQVVEPAALWMQEELESDEAEKTELHRFVESILKSFDRPPGADAFCANLRDRAGLIVDYGKDHYLFRHKTFREFLAARQLVKKALEPGRIETLVSRLGEDWWEEPLRFFMSRGDADLFDRFMDAYFKSGISREPDERQHSLLVKLIREAPQKETKSLINKLGRQDLHDRQLRLLLDCLKATGRVEALQAVHDADRTSWSESNRNYADDIAAESIDVLMKETVVEEALRVRGAKATEPPRSFRNPLEDNVEYILIPGGTYTYPETENEVTVPNLYFCKYPVTNKLYRRFISYLAGEEKELNQLFPLERFAPKLREFARQIKDFIERSGNKPDEWLKAFTCHDDRRFNGPDQPVAGISWYGARAYCFWLASLEAAWKGDFENYDVDTLSSVYRLPREWEWLWAAAGREPDGSLRKYPWHSNKGEPTPELANYDNYVGTTTPVGRYPEGATPEDLLDMAGNVWEWMENLYIEGKDGPALRGGSWGLDRGYLRCSTRVVNDPHFKSSLIGFRVLRCQLEDLP